MRQPSDLRLPLLITGLAGVPGYNAFAYFRKRLGDSVLAIRPHRNWRLTGPGILACDTDDEAGMDALWDEHRFQSVLSFAGSCHLKACELDPQMAERINVQGTRNVARNAARYNARMIHLSSDLVFAGRSGGNYSEADEPDPVTVYGKTMVVGEQEVQDICPAACVLRISLPMGPSFNGHAGAIDWIESRFAKNKPATLYFDEVRTPTYVDCMNRLYDRLLRRSEAGLFHAGGPRAMSLYEIAQVINRVGGYNPKMLKGCPRIEAGPMPPRAGNVTMNSDKLCAVFGEQVFAPWPNQHHLIPEHRTWHHQRNGDTGSPERVVELLT
ncbi:SDR family oxidoreductase [Roseimaritima ulvae]|uniref:dTDP-4-dehydrorhamnose reductase n=1 Tax=Roseimaritima ulvae TaxID=980254 RepID=A0A5B9QP01_9BACT|nr:sugar nucleotide-binding protein [Roseimaritima ulvae]QEG40748.1 dTDP-4-dehydrorhamnose reductase [Roseimaritima ulvae]